MRRALSLSLSLEIYQDLHAVSCFDFVLNVHRGYHSSILKVIQNSMLVLSMNKITISMYKIEGMVYIV